MEHLLENNTLKVLLKQILNLRKEKLFLIYKIKGFNQTLIRAFTHLILEIKIFWKVLGII
jgi:hypothetical protein